MIHAHRPRRRGRSTTTAFSPAGLAVLGAVALFGTAACGSTDTTDTADTTQAADAGADPGSSADDRAGTPTIVATTPIWADIAGNVACDGLAEVESLMPAGADPHSYEPSLADRSRLDEAGLVISNGLGLESSLADLIDQAAADGAPLFVAGDHVDALPYAAGGHDDHDHGDEAAATDDHAEDGHTEDDHAEDGHTEDDHAEDDHTEDDHTDEAATIDDATTDDGETAGDDHDGEALDPHIWLDPIRTSAVVDALSTVLVDDLGLDADAVTACTDAYRAELTETDTRITEITGVIPADRRVLVTNHDAIGYFADRYDFEVVGTVIPSTSGLAETNPAQLTELSATIEAEGVPAIFVSSSDNAEQAQVLADQLGIAVVPLPTDTLGGDGPATYVELLLADADVIAGGLAP
ncbi:MAG: metal ABC transporter solute-binding protein, Zn/Mn family [Acidimicrobiales bacterium]